MLRLRPKKLPILGHPSRPSTSLTFSRRSLFTKSTGPTQSPLRTALYTTVFALSTGLFAVYYFDARSALHRYVLTPVLRYALDAETGHKVAVKVLRSGLGPRDPIRDEDRLRAEIWGQEISNPIGLAAGFDKDAEAVDGLLDLGFSWVEIGSVTPKPQPGNPRPRVFHLPNDAALINRYGFPSQGAASVLARLRARIPTFYEPDATSTAALRPGAVLAVNLGKNKTSAAESVDDFVTGVKTFGSYSDVLVVNVSSPNTPGLRGLQNRDLLESLLSEAAKARDELPPSPLTLRRPKLVLKLAPDLEESQIIDIADVIRHSKIDGVIVSNTTIQRPSSLTDPNKLETGGLSGVPLKPHSLRALRTLRTHLPASVPLIGCGGISSGADALEFAQAGASLVQVYTGFGYDGAGACRRIKDELSRALEAEGKTWGEVVNQAVEDLSLKEPKPVMQVERGEASIKNLIQEAEELKSVLDRLGDRIGAEEDKLGSESGQAMLTVIS
ncbi:hypothetical protein SERLA73DRAFT_113756 [Serpula lacrymans var. lacrymans S7.3]|uniref:Dihydroorotate dehydrogenase (quinone), mitochondrial n=2 Tax=Serpula lacrymans var. lacrymans TaxID=341189 RepID=F8Q8X0_SERL3|nr:uncharacterized protein SERLADRAFT_363420 [Serpula lacrymans var. lacrymans S7.9]EGN95025.1 hypothetical protein SERLA73DRAFT_113756 [Serpula lacrymans var. lacrymans S7.3]EGO20519.1 hypothetical protein SERLADRAFT_363420 [Serpula lacrymans var. lacrymans S7.9]